MKITSKNCSKLEIVLSLLFLFLLINKASYSQQQWIAFTNTNPESPTITLLDSENSFVSFQTEIYGMYSKEIDEQGTTYQRISIPSCSKTDEIGNPEIPVIRQLIAIPNCQDVTLSTYTNNQVALQDYFIYPVPELVEVQYPDSTMVLEEQFNINTNLYNIDDFYPNVKAEIKSIGYLRDQRVAEVLIYPISFNPVLKQLEIYTDITLTISFNNPTSEINKNTGIFNNVAANTILNYTSSGIRADINDRPGYIGNIEWVSLTDQNQAGNIVGDYLIITDEQFWDPANPDSEVARIANHRAEYNGFDISIVRVDQVIDVFIDHNNPVDHKHSRAIRDFIKEVYEGENASHTYDMKLGYVLLIGDADNTDVFYGIPSSYEQGGYEFEYPSDYFYSCVTVEDDNYDWIGDLYIGRLSAENDDQLANFIAKIKSFEDEVSLDGWRKRISFTNDDSYHPDFIDEFYNVFITNLFQDQTLNTANQHLENIGTKTLDFIESGTLIMSYLGHGNVRVWGDQVGDNGIRVSELITLENDYKCPVALSIACFTGGFDEVQTSPNNCMAEDLTTYSDTRGFVGFLGAGRKIWQSGVSNTYVNDPPKYIHENLPYSIWHGLSFITGEFILEAKLKTDSPDYCAQYQFNYFGDPAMNIMAPGFEITRNYVIPCDATISTVIYVRSGNTLTINCAVDFAENGQLIIDQGASLKLVPGCEITGANLDNKIIVNGNLIIEGQQTPQKCLLTAPENMNWTGIVLANTSNAYDLHDITFERCGLEGEAAFLFMEDCEFFDGGIDFHEGKLQIINTQFDEGFVKATYGATGQPVIITGCTFDNQETNAYPIMIDGYEYFDLQNNTIAHKEVTGVAIYNCKGTKGAQVQRLYNNQIYSNVVGGASETNLGIKLYNSHVEILDNNYVYNNNIGVACYNTSQVSILGDCNASNVEESQRIINNAERQIYATSNSFPTTISFNSIFDDQATSYYIYYSDEPGSQYPVPTLDVSNNYWGTNFNPQQHLHPYEAYIYQPIWNFGCQKSGTPETLYNIAVGFVENQQYDSAEAKYMELILDYTEDKFAQAAVKELFALKGIHDQDYAGLKQFYDTTSVLNDTTSISRLSDWLSNKCDVKLENYQQAINWYEAVIASPETEEDSVFSIIDLGYVYLLMGDTTSRAGVNCVFPQYRPNSRELYEKYRDQLLALLGSDNQSSHTEEKIPVNDQNQFVVERIVPNPFRSTFTVYMVAKKALEISIEVYDLSGKLIERSPYQYYNTGDHQIDFNLNDYPHGVYNCFIKNRQGAAIHKKLVKM